jgi:hypothetical protein
MISGRERAPAHARARGCERERTRKHELARAQHSYKQR